MSVLEMIEPQDAQGEVAEIYGDIQREMGIPFVPNLDKALALAPNALRGTWEAVRNVFLRTSLPMSLAMMILFKVAATNKCNYCGSLHKANCMASGVDADMLEALENDLESLSPLRVQAIVKFAEKCAAAPHSLTDGDYDAVRSQGVSDEEIVEIVTLAALGNYLDTIADALKLEVDDMIAQALAS
ncbi:MAG TPA: hypothetical protein EYQ81_10260 [Sneathiellales bacterium]|nr:hypothetical protein [Sneathiellales bacterium]